MFDTASLNPPIKIYYKYPKVLCQRMMEGVFKTLSTSIINSPMYAPFLITIKKGNLEQFVRRKSRKLHCA